MTLQKTSCYQVKVVAETYSRSLSFVGMPSLEDIKTVLGYSGTGILDIFEKGELFTLYPDDKTVIYKFRAFRTVVLTITVTHSEAYVGSNIEPIVPHSCDYIRGTYAGRRGNAPEGNPSEDYQRGFKSGEQERAMFGAAA